MNKKHYKIKDEDLVIIRNILFESFRLSNAQTIGRFTYASIVSLFETLPEDLYIRQGSKFVKYEGGK